MTATLSPIRLRTRAKTRPHVDLAARVIRDVSVVSHGLAEGHDLWIDREFLAEVYQAMTENTAGTPACHEHYGREIGYLRAPRLTDDAVRADLHLNDSDEARYLLQLATEDPAAFGLSIHFQNDVGAEAAFRREHQDQAGRFTSPDVDNMASYPHARLADLQSADVVAEPAANPNGLFNRPPAANLETWDGLLEWLTGLRDTPPARLPFDVHVDRVKPYIERFLAARGLTIRRRPGNSTPKQTPVPTRPDAATQPKPAAPTTGREALLRAMQLRNESLQRRLEAARTGRRPEPANPCRVRRES
jgi:hypothetical protein